MSEEFITISKKEYDELIENSFKLDCLEAGGVNNWEWFHESLKPFYKEFYPDDEKEEEDDD